MKFIKLKAAGIAAAVATLASVNTPVNAAGVSDGTGVDFDPACIIGDPTAQVPTANYISSPGAPGGSLGIPPGGSGCDGISVYDGSTESTDFGNVDLSSVGGQLVATFTVDGNIPAAGSTTAPALGGADEPGTTFTGVGYKLMFQNSTRQTNTPYVAATRIGTGTPIFGLNEHWQDGFHFFIGFDAAWDGTRWVHSAQIGTYDPDPDGGFVFDELGVSQGNGWVDDDPACFSRAGGNWSASVVGSTVTVKVKGIVKASNVQAVGGCVESWYAKAGDSIINIKGLSTANEAGVLPLTIPLSLIPGFGDLTSVGGYFLFSDITTGNSRNFGHNATLAGATGDNPSTACVNEGRLGNRPCVSFTGGHVGLADKHDRDNAADTLGEGPRCWTPTGGGMTPPNPQWVPNQPCHIDDDSAPGPTGNVDPGERGTFLAEWWDTPVGFTF